MKSILLIFLIAIFPFKQKKIETLIGTYYSVNNKFEKSSIMQLKEHGKYSYKYSLGGCQAEITGDYVVLNNRIRFNNDIEFLNTKSSEFGMPIYPNLNLVEWKITSNYIKPTAKIDCGCFMENGKHIKKE